MGQAEVSLLIVEDDSQPEDSRDSPPKKTSGIGIWEAREDS